jgi:hypothetical protein
MNVRNARRSEAQARNPDGGGPGLHYQLARNAHDHAAKGKFSWKF